MLLPVTLSNVIGSGMTSIEATEAIPSVVRDISWTACAVILTLFMTLDIPLLRGALLVQQLHEFPMLLRLG